MKPLLFPLVLLRAPHGPPSSALAWSGSLNAGFCETDVQLASLALPFAALVQLTEEGSAGAKDTHPTVRLAFTEHQLCASTLPPGMFTQPAPPLSTQVPWLWVQWALGAVGFGSYGLRLAAGKQPCVHVGFAQLCYIVICLWPLLDADFRPAGFLYGFHFTSL